MPLSTQTTDDCRGIIHIATGVVTGDELVTASRQALQLVQNTQNFDYEIVDLTKAIGLIRAGEEHLEQITMQDHLAAVYRPNAIVIIIAIEDDCFDLGQRWQRRVADLGWSTLVTRERSEAKKWLRENYDPAAITGTIKSKKSEV